VLPLLLGLAVLLVSSILLRLPHFRCLLVPLLLPGPIVLQVLARAVVVVVVEYLLADAGVAALLRRFARVALRVRLVPSDVVLLAVASVVAVVVAVVPCQLSTAAALVVATIMLLVVDTKAFRMHVFRPEPAEPDSTQNLPALVDVEARISAVLVALDRRCAGRLLLVAVLVAPIAVAALVAVAVALVGVQAARLVALVFLRQLAQVLWRQRGRRRDDRAIGVFRRRVHDCLGDLVVCWVHFLPVPRHFGAVCPLQ